MKSGQAANWLLASVVALALGWYLFDVNESETPRPKVADTVQPAVAAPVINQPAAANRAAATSSEDEASPSMIQLAEQIYAESPIEAVRDFRAELQEFASETKLLPTQDYQSRARELLATVDRFETEGYLTGPETLALRLSLLRYALPPDEYRDSAQRLIDAARQQTAKAEQAWATRSDPRHERYRQLEREIVEQSITMTSFPEGQTRQDYLRERLLALRTEIYSADPDGANE